MAWQTVNSSWLAAVDYRAEEMALYVRFKDKRGRFTVTARYDNVDPTLGFGLLEAPSKGEYFHSSGLIRRRYTLV
jgi:hypothetical protein